MINWITDWKSGLLTVFLVCGMRGSADARLPLVTRGEPRAVIVLPETPEADEQLAADELAEHIRLITGAVLPVETGIGTDGMAAIRLGRAADPALDDRIRATGDNPSAFALVVDDQGVQLRGLTAAGTLTAAYELLEQFGVRWYMPGDIGRVLPVTDSLSVAVQHTVQAPAFIGRPGSRHEAAQAWNRRLRASDGIRFSSHNMRGFHSRRLRQQIFAEHPEYFALIDGERQPRQLCLTNSTDDLAQNAVFHLVLEAVRERLRADPDRTVVAQVNPQDGRGYCECDHCRALDPPFSTPFAGMEPSYTDRYIWFINHLAEALEDDFPDVIFGFFAYHLHLLPPVQVKPHRKIAMTLAPIHVCRRHGPNNPVCTESNQPLVVLDAWLQYIRPEQVSWFAYQYNLADPGFLFPMVHRMREEIPAVFARGVTRWTGGPSDAWAAHLPTTYVTLKLFWDPATDVEALMEEFYEKFYGPAAVPMKRYHEHVEDRLRDGNFHAGSVWDVPHLYDGEWRAAAWRHLDAAHAAADGIYMQRIDILRRQMEMLDAYCASRAAREAFDFVAEKQAMRRTESLRDALLEEFEYPMLFPRHARSLFRRFVETPALRHDESTGEGRGDIVARFDPEWDFILDREQWGHYAGYHLPVLPGANWQRLRTDLTWSAQGLHHVYGPAWYRQTVYVPAEVKGRGLHLWFSGVNDTADVWVNGAYVGGNHDGAEFDVYAFGASFRPFQLAIADALRYGGENVVTVRVNRRATGEVGIGGLIGPVMLYVPPESE